MLSVSMLQDFRGYRSNYFFTFFRIPYNNPAASTPTRPASIGNPGGGGGPGGGGSIWACAVVKKATANITKHNRDFGFNFAITV